MLSACLIRQTQINRMKDDQNLKGIVCIDGTFPKLGRIPLIFLLYPIMKRCNIVLPVTSHHIIIIIYYFITVLLISLLLFCF